MTTTIRRTITAATIACLLVATTATPALAELVPPRSQGDSRVRIVPYSADEVLLINGYVGYQIHFQFGQGEEFINLGTGDQLGIDVGKEGSHLFIKPKAQRVGTNITLITNRRAYHLHYTALSRAPDPKRDDIVYSVRFTYPEDDAREAQVRREAEEREARFRAQEAALAAAASQRSRNDSYEFCGSQSLRPIEAYDDGVQTRLRFPARAEIPAVFLKNEDGTESLVNLNVDRDELVLHRVARRWILRRGQLVACVRNAAFDGGGVRLPSGTVHPEVERAVKPAAGSTPVPRRPASLLPTPASADVQLGAATAATATAATP